LESKIDISEFRNRLSKNTSIGNPNINGTPLVVFTMLDSSNKKLYGRINNNSFEITRHNTFYPIPYKIKGVFNSDNESKTKVNYIIKPIWFGYLWIRIIPAVFLLFVFSGAIWNPDLTFPLGIFGSIIMLMFIVNIYRIERRKRNFEIDFKRTFEIT